MEELGYKPDHEKVMITSLQLNPTGMGRVGRVPGSQSHILHERGSLHHWRGVGALSIKCFAGGRAFYDVGVGRYAVDDNSYLILNEGQTYSIEIDSRKELESFCIFFEPGFAEDVWCSLNTATPQLLEGAQGKSAAVNFFERTYGHDQILSPALFSLRAQVDRRRGEPEWLTEQLHGIMGRMLMVHARTRKEVDDIRALRPSSREELYRRLYRARDYARACLDQPITLNQMAGVACLSANHFLRTFKQVFHQTPHQYLTHVRIERAQALLQQTDQRVTDICFAVGFESIGSFSWLFRQRVGLAPKAYRLAKR